MSAPDLRPTLDLLRKVLQAEIRQQYRNRSTAGGVQAFFRAQFDKYEYDEASAATAQSILAYLRRYERAAAEEERASLAALMLRKLDATQARIEDGTAGATSTTEAQRHRGNTEIQEDQRTGHVRSLAGDDHSGAKVAAQDRVGTNGVRERQPEPPPEPVVRAPIGGPAWSDEAGDEELSDEEFEEEAEAPSPTTGATRHTAQGSAAAAAAAEPAQAAAPAGISLDADAAEALGIRKQEQGRLEQLGISTLRSLLEYWPRDHYDYSAPVRINRMAPGMQTTLLGTLRAVEARRTPNKNLQIVEAKVTDPTGMMAITWFNQPFLLRSLKPRVGEEIAISGAVEMRGGRLVLTPRDVEFPADDEDGTNTRRIVPVYPSSEGIAQRWIRRAVSKAISIGAGLVPDPLPDAVRRQHGLMERRIAVAQYHFPATLEARDRARNRLALDELLLIQLGMLGRKQHWQIDEEGKAIPADAALLDAFRAGLPFTLTGAQERALDEILADMRRPIPMSRLLQGDVGSGKTVVAAAALLTCARAGMQGAIMAPTEILAEQHARTLAGLLAPHGVSVALLTGSLTKAQRARIYLEAYQGKIQVLAGTHALIQEEFKFGNLGLAIVDEQHRFGVAQRAALKGKGFSPHLLVMTATPIPRTLTLTIYGDLDVSVIDERPPNRQPVETRWLSLDKQAYSLVREQVKFGRQAYIICPLVEESESLEVKAAVAEAKRLGDEVFPDLRLGLLHGKMRPQEKDEVLGRFRDGAIDVLVATSVVEVGIDVPNATVMVVQDAQRFGLAQLHQFRGRVGRGAAQSYCLLLADANNPAAGKRLQALCDTDDGFKLAEEDLKLRGPGEFWGTRQSGLPALQVAQVTDMPTLSLARRVAETIMADDPHLDEPRHALLAEQVRQFWERAAAPS